MCKRQILASLVAAANTLDILTEYRDADVLTRIAQEVADQLPDDPGMGDTGDDADFGGGMSPDALNEDPASVTNNGNMGTSGTGTPDVSLPAVNDPTTPTSPADPSSSGGTSSQERQETVDQLLALMDQVEENGGQPTASESTQMQQLFRKLNEDHGGSQSGSAFMQSLQDAGANVLP